MKIIKQLSESEFVIRMEETDLKNETLLLVEHDYVQFGVNMGIQTSMYDVKEPIYGKYAFCANWVNSMFNVQIPIRDMVKFVLPYLNEHEYCTEEHIKDNYYGESVIKFFNGKKEPMIALRTETDDDFIIIPETLYNTIKEIGKKENKD